MKRASVALLLVMALLTGFALRPTVFQSRTAVDSASAVANSETAQGFYDALNHALGGADTAPLAARMSPVFASHTSDTGTTQSADEFLGEVRAIAASPQRPRLEVISSEASGTNVVVGVRPVWNGMIEVAGVKVEQSLPGPHYEVIRVERGKIVDRWAPAFPWLNATESIEEPLSLSSFSGIDTTLVRVELVDSHEYSWRATGLGMMIVESGSVRVQFIRGNGTSAPVVLEPGSFTSIPHGARVRLRSADGHPVSAVLYAASKIAPSSSSLPVGNLYDEEAFADSLNVLWSGPIYWSQSATIHRSARIVLPVGSVIELVPSPGADLLLGGDAGMIEIGSARATVMVLGDDRWPVITEGVVQLDANHAATISGEGIVSVRNLSDVPVSLVLISIEKAPVSERLASPCADSC